ncbi:hypothetical protein KIN20_025719 [Parelaphostrongylus tenuis]|uniref:7TM GPCR serpentine receptor class x (Srx) domain-containing protein n=1 Tax=Parelaphostrongylus tenuis TaxID=148309 RepID=A0AAD5QXT8_PARTN|nr:hypothetical protein KIN20_025719 [Parelaphostrongylus tenuis]
MTGYLAIKGAVFCTDPVFLLSLGAFGCGCWCASCMICILLALSRCADLSENRCLKAIFEGYRVYFLMFITVLYLLFIMFFTTPASFNSNYVSWFFDPMTGHQSVEYVNVHHAINNVIVSIITTLLYIYLCVKLYRKSKTTVSKLGKFQTQVFIQSFLICLNNVVAAYIYVYMQYFPTPKLLVIIGQIAWQLSAGLVCIVYLVVNRAIRRGVIELVIPERWKSELRRALAPTTVTPSHQVAN